MTTDDLIVELAGRLTPVRRLPTLRRQLAGWLLLSIPIVTIAAFALGLRPDAAVAGARGAFATMFALALLTTVIAGAAALQSGIPGAASAAGIWAPAAALAGWGLATAMFLTQSPAPPTATFPVHLLCAIQIAALAAVPALALMIRLRRAAPLQPLRTGTLTALAAAALAAAATQWLCPSDDPLHLLAGHIGVAAVLAAAGGWALAPAFTAVAGHGSR